MKDLTNEQITVGLKTTEYFFNKYGKDKTEFIISRIASGVRNYDLRDMISIGEKIALVNKWITLEEINELGIK